DDVGKDTYHHTFFEMLGNWSFGDYFKAEAIDWAWELLTDVWGLEPDRLHATYFEGDESEGLEPDLEAKKLWSKYLPDERIHPGNKKDNFWEMGDTGPCGPCSELHYDGTPDKSGAKLVNADDPDVIEIWNLVFIQFNRMTSGELENLPAKHVDTGMGFERIVRVLQGKDSNYDTDVFAPIFAAIQKITGARAYLPGGSGENLTDPINVAYRVIADHIRTLTFALTDGAHCGNEGRNYVLRSILRRAVRFGRQTLGVNDPFFYKLVPAVVDAMGEAFPELKNNPDAVSAEIRDEEESFSKTLDRGIVLFDEAAERGGKTIAAQDAFQLHDTYGFPISLTQLMAEERGMSVDVAGFERLMEEARAKSRGAGGGADAKASLIEQVQKGFDAGWYAGTNFTGYETSECPPQKNRLHLFKKEGDVYGSALQAKPGDEVAVVLQMTPFYAEQGGQVGDTGSMIVRNSVSATGGEMVRVKITDCIKVGDVHVHLGTVSAGTLENADGDVSVALAVDLERRKAIEANHTITHVMNRALRDHVNEDAAQRGSLVDDEKTRFDFAHGSALTDDQLAAVEQQVNDDIAADLPVFAAYAPQEQALQISGLRAVFGEKYPPTVRVVSIGADPDAMLADPGNEAWAGRSVEFCGGTHMSKTGQAEAFCVLSQEAVSKGVRRVTAVTGEPAQQALRQGEALLQELAKLSDLPTDQLPERVDAIIKDIEAATVTLRQRAALRSQLGELNEKVKKARKAAGSQNEQAVVETARNVAEAGGETLIVSEISGADGKTLRVAMDVIRKKRPSSAMLLAASSEGKVALLASVPEDAVKKGLRAGDWIREIASMVGGGGGGRPDMAQAGGKDASKLPEALEAARAFAAKHLG
ncbi:MAG: alanine--tRNA ligase, partial [Planctomycetota bacterium]